MKNVVLDGRKSSLDNLFLKVGQFSTDSELMSHWARYLCVLVYGLIEISVREIISDYAKSRSTPEIANFVKWRVSRVWDWDMDEILNTIGRFDSTFKNDLEEAIDQEHKDALNSVVGNRHKIAHGDSVSLTFASTQEYYGKVIEVLEMIEDKINP